MTRKLNSTSFLNASKFVLMCIHSVQCSNTHIQVHTYLIQSQASPLSGIFFALFLPNLKLSFSKKFPLKLHFLCVIQCLVLAHDHSQWILNTLLTIFCADHRGRLGSEDETIDHIIDTFEKYRAAYRSVKFEDVFKDGKKETVKDQMFKARVSAVKGSK